MSKNPRLGRRSFMGGLGATALTLPLARAFKTQAQVGDSPTRLIVFFSSNGTIRENWLPTGTEHSFTLSPILAPLAPHQDKLVVLDGINMTSANYGPGASHAKGPSQLLSAVELQEGNLFSHMTAGDFGWGGGITVDQFIADRLETLSPTRFRSLEFGVRLLGNSPHNRISYRGAAQAIPPMENPYAAIDTIFGDGTGSSPTDGLATLELAQQQYGALARRFTGSDQVRVEAHERAIGDLRASLSGPGSEACTAPTYPTSYHPRDMAAVPYHTRLQIDTMVAALACDQTRVATFMYENGNGQKVPTWLDIYEPHHQISHRQDAESVAKLTAINADIGSHFSYLLEKLDSIPEGSGTMLDNSFVVWANELGNGRYHRTENVPFVLAGGAGGYFETGRFLTAGGQDHNRLLISMCHAMGLTDVESFGKEGLQTGPIVGL